MRVLILETIRRLRSSRWRSPQLVILVLAGLGVLAITGRREAPPTPVPDQAFPTSTASDRGATVWAVGDGADGSPAARALARKIADTRPDRLLYLGDVYDRGTREQFKSGYESVYGALAEVTAPTPGNHDWPNRAVGYDQYWRGVKGAAPPPWYRFRLGGWDILSLNSEAPHGPGSKQLEWLDKQLRERGTCRLAFLHRPRYSAGMHGDQPDLAPLWNALRARATLVVSGHDHNLQRLKPIGGLTQLVAGAGGRSHYALDAGDARLAFARDDVDGAVRLTLEPGRVRVEFVSAGGAILDRSSATCAAGPATRRAR